MTCPNARSCKLLIIISVLEGVWNTPTEYVEVQPYPLLGSDFQSLKEKKNSSMTRSLMHIWCIWQDGLRFVNSTMNLKCSLNVRTFQSKVRRLGEHDKDQEYKLRSEDFHSLKGSNHVTGQVLYAFISKLVHISDVGWTQHC